MIWSTHKRQKALHKEAQLKLSSFLSEYAKSQDIYMMTNFVNDDHVHILIDLPTGSAIEDMAKLLKGASSHWINQNRIVGFRFAWSRGYAAFSVSQSAVKKVADYIANQEEHHRTKSFEEEYQAFLKRYGLDGPPPA